MEQTNFYQASQLREEILKLQLNKDELEREFNNKNNMYRLNLSTQKSPFNNESDFTINLVNYFDIDDFIKQSLQGIQEKIEELEEEFSNL